MKNLTSWEEPHDLGYLQDKFGFSDEDLQSVPQAPL